MAGGRLPELTYLLSCKLHAKKTFIGQDLAAEGDTVPPMLLASRLTKRSNGLFSKFTPLTMNRIEASVLSPSAPLCKNDLHVPALMGLLSPLFPFVLVLP